MSDYMYPSVKCVLINDVKNKEVRNGKAGIKKRSKFTTFCLIESCLAK